MGTFAELHTAENAAIPQEKREEFLKRIELVFQSGGMMEVDIVQIQRKRIVLLKKAAMHEDGMDFYYNYFEDDSWENAGFSKKGFHVYSGKIGWSWFNHAVLAAYELERLYTEGAAIVEENGEAIIIPTFRKWFRYLFGDTLPRREWDPWALFVMLKNDEYAESILDSIRWEDLIEGNKSFMGCCAVKSVLQGTQYTVEWLESIQNQDKSEAGASDDSNLSYPGVLRNIREAVQAYRNQSTAPEPEQADTLLDILRQIYLERENHLKRWIDDASTGRFTLNALLSDDPVFCVKAVCEQYDLEFWSTWSKTGDLTQGIHYKKPEYDFSPTGSISTVRFFKQDADDMIPYWEPGGDLAFSDELENWFAELRTRYDRLSAESPSVEHPLTWINEMLEFADEEYYQVFCFSDFYEESLEHLCDVRYLTLWQLFYDMLHDPEMKALGMTVFAPDQPESQQNSLWGNEGRHRLSESWSFMPREKKRNPARMALRRYMALVANKALRNQVFGF